MSKARDLANAGTALTSVSATELGYVDGVTSAIQTQIDSKIGSASAINPTIVDAKGDIIAATAADTPARIAVGANDTVLTADSTTATGLKWGTPSSGSMTLLSTTTLSGASTTISSINQTYQDLLIFIDSVNVPGGGSFRLDINGAQVNALGSNGTGGSSVMQMSTENFIRLVGNQNNIDAGNTTNVFSLRIQNYATSTTGKTWFGNGYFFHSSTDYAAINYGGGTAVDTAITSLKFYATSGNINAGTVFLYGVK